MSIPHFDPIEASHEIADRYRRYLRTMFYFRDPELRASFEKALDDWELVRGPYLEATPVYRRVGPVSEVLREVLGEEIDPGFARAAIGDRPLFSHQEEAISADDRRPPLGQLSFAAMGIGLIKIIADNQLQNRIPQKFEALVGGRLGPTPLADIGGMCQSLQQQGGICQGDP